MFNNRMLAVAAVLVMAVPALGAAAPIVVPPVPEQLVEGHTVFTVIEIISGEQTRTNETRFAAAVAVLVREYNNNARVNAQRFPGVLWFNDQYLVNPEQGDGPGGGASFRYPCGGAVMAVNAGDPDPRMVIARVGTPGVEADLPDGVDDQTGDVDVDPASGATFGYDSATYGPDQNKPYPGTYYYGYPGNETDYAWIGVDGQNVNATNPSADPGRVYSDTVVGGTAGALDGNLFNLSAPWDYRESYLITDPNDHSWIIDKYEFYTRDSTSQQQNVDNLGTKLLEDPAPNSEHSPVENGGLLVTEYRYPVWVVNMLGSPVFVPDNLPLGDANNCSPYKDLVEQIEEIADATASSVGCVDEDQDDATACTQVYPTGTLPNKETFACNTGATYSGAPAWTDDPCMGYQEPSRNGFCYGGQAAFDVDGDTDVDADDCANREQFPLRQYNALLYFKLEDLYVAGASRDHSDPVASGDTNGCSQEQYTWGPNPPFAGSDWPCPGGDDDAEGNSHPFHPGTPTHTEAEDCREEFYGPNPTNHGGSTYIPAGMRASDSGWYEVTAPCDYEHATRNIDVYYNGGGRPFVPIVRNFVITDIEGSSAPFQDYHQAYPNAP